MSYLRGVNGNSGACTNNQVYLVICASAFPPYSLAKGSVPLLRSTYSSFPLCDLSPTPSPFPPYPSPVNGESNTYVTINVNWSRISIMTNLTVDNWF